MRTYIYADESGNFDFSLNPGASRFFILTTVMMTDLAVGNELLELRRELAWEGLELRDGFHATVDKQAIRDRAFEIIGRHNFAIYTTVIEKRKAQPSIRPSENRFYKNTWFFHLRSLAEQVDASFGQLMVVAASLGKNRGQETTHLSNIRDVLSQTITEGETGVVMWPANSDPCLQIVDYCSWAIQRKWERSDTRSYDLIRDKITIENDVFRNGTTLYY